MVSKHRYFLDDPLRIFSMPTRGHNLVIFNNTVSVVYKEKKLTFDIKLVAGEQILTPIC